MSDGAAFAITFTALAAVFLAFHGGREEGKDDAIEDCADEAISETPAKWWKDALIDARARREKAETK